MKALLAIVVASASMVGLNAGRGGDPTTFVKAGPLEVSDAAINHIVNHETGGYAYFQKYYQRPQDPKFASGVTIGFGYDLKYHSRSQIRNDWAGVASTAEIDAMCSVAGMDGSVYRRIRDKVHVTWEEAMVVFKRTTLPRWSQNTYDAYKLEGLTIHPDLAGALVGNTFNRGTKINTSDRYIEKYRRRQAIADRRWEDIPQTFIDEQRHWPTHARLKQRRREEADLSRAALKWDWWIRAN